jgi:hypothetical protein
MKVMRADFDAVMQRAVEIDSHCLDDVYDGDED